MVLENKPTQLIRKLSGGESLYVKHDTRILFVSKLQGPLTVKILEDSLQELANRHPYLRHNVLKKQNDYFFTPIENPIIPLHIEDNFPLSEEINKFVQKQLLLQTRLRKSLIRVSLLVEGDRENIEQKSKLVLIVDTSHAISDGLSGLNLVHELLTISSYKLQFTGAKLTLPSLIASPPLEELLPTSGNITAKEIEEGLLNRIKSSKPIYLSLKQETSNDKKIVLKFIELNAEDTKKFKDRCKENKTTVQAALGAAFSLAIYSLLENGAPGRQVIFNSPIDVREKLTPSLGPEVLLSAATTNYIFAPVAEEMEKAGSLENSFWPLAGEFTKNLKQNNEQLISSECHTAGKQVFMKAKENVTLHVSNVGVAKLQEQYGPLKLEEIYFFPTGFFPLIPVSVTTFKGHLRAIVHYTSPWYSEETIEKFSTKALELIKQQIE